MSTNNPLWSLFLESSCSSASVFFKLHLSTRSYFHSPTPWTNPNSNISRKVARLLDSFKPGSTSYCPFPNEEDGGNLTPGTPSPQSNENNEESHPRLVRPSDVSTTQPTGNNITSQEHDTSTLENPDRAATSSSEETMRRRLYLNVGRPRPFYRVSSSPASPSSSPDTQSFTEQNSVFQQQNNLINRPNNKVSGITYSVYCQQTANWNNFFNRPRQLGLFRNLSETFLYQNTASRIFQELSRMGNFSHNFLLQ